MSAPEEIQSYIEDFRSRIESGEEVKIRRAASKGSTLGIVECTLNKGALASVQIFMLMEKLGEKGEVIQTSPDGEAISEGRFEGKLATLLAYRDSSEILPIFTEFSLTPPTLTPVTVADLGVDETKHLNLAEVNGNQEVDFLIDKVENLILTKNSVTMTGDESSGSLQQIEEVKVKVKDMNELFQRVEELVLIRNRYIRLFDVNDYQSIREVNTTLDRTTNDLYTHVLKMRLTPLDQIFNHYKRKVAETAEQIGKEVDFIISGESVSVDRTILEELISPLEALLCNAVEHGVESPDERRAKKKMPVGTIRLTAAMEEDTVVIRVEDDGVGLDVDRLKNVAYKKGLVNKASLDGVTQEDCFNMLCLPGFSTRDDSSGSSEMTLYAVKQRIESHGGSLEIFGEKDKGTRFTLIVPTNMTIQRVLLFRLGDQIIATPSSLVNSILPGKEVEPKAELEGVKLMEYREKVIPIYYLHKVLSLDEYEHKFGLILQRRNKICCVTASDVIGFEEVVVKTLDNNKYLDLPWLMGTTILSDGRATPIMDLLLLVQNAK